MNEIHIIDLKFNIEQGTLSFVLNLWIFLVAVALFFFIYYLIRHFIKSGKTGKKITPVKLKYSFGGAEIVYEIKRNYQSIEIAHRIYIELITRKAALKIDENHDVIVEIYESWYTLFQTTREELKKLSGEMLVNNDVSNDLIKLLTDILNKGLRPHLTEHQAKFRKWYDEAITQEKNKELSPQQIQSKYKSYNELIESMKEVNQLLIEHARKLLEIINGKS
jgi:hypothetical protein